MLYWNKEEKRISQHLWAQTQETPMFILWGHWVPVFARGKNGSM
jgi:hypothetical protein